MPTRFQVRSVLTLKALGVCFLLTTFEVQSFPIRNFVTFLNIKCKIRKKVKKFRNLLLGPCDMTIFGEWAL